MTKGRSVVRDDKGEGGGERCRGGRCREMAKGWVVVTDEGEVDGER